MAEPAFEVADVVGPARLELRSPLMTYSIVAAPCADDAAAEYREFADWYAQLNTLTRPRALPPFARMEVNRRLAEKSQAPQEIELTLKSSKLGSATRFRSVHEFGWKLLAEDRRAIEQLGRQLAEFEAVALEDYLGSHRETRLAKKK